MRSTAASAKGKKTWKADKARDCSLGATHASLCPATHGLLQKLPTLPIQQGMVQVLTQTLQDLVMVPDGRGLIFTCSKVALQLKGKKNALKIRSE